ncbi:MAG: sulfite exporter TauE/SafE family protein [Acidobacteriota bacterium]
MKTLPDISLTYFVVLLAAALIGGAANALAGGGTFLVFPALLLGGMDSIVANATSAASMFPGNVASSLVFKRGTFYSPILLRSIFAVSVVGGAAGTTLVLMTPSERFSRLVPYLMLVAAVVFSFSDRIARATRNGSGNIRWVPLLAGHFLISVYGGYFGAGMGVLMIILFWVAADLDVKTSGALRLYSALGINSLAVAIFAARGVVAWKFAVPMALAAIVGGYWGAHLVKRLSITTARRSVLVYAWVITVWLLIRSS